MSENDPDRDARERLERWAREHGPAVRGYVLGFVRRWDVAEDVAQDVFRRAWQARDRYQETGEARAYLLKIADRLVIDRFRKKRAERQLDDEGWRAAEPVAATPDPDAGLVAADDRERLEAALDQLSEPQRRVLLMRFYGQLEFAQIAEQLGCPLNTALSHCHRGLKRLKTILGVRAP